MDFGGIVTPASAIAMTSEICVGNIAKATAPRPDFTRSSKLARPPDPTHEVDAGVRPRVADAEDRAEEPVLEDRDVEEAMGSETATGSRGVRVCQMSSKKRENCPRRRGSGASAGRTSNRSRTFLRKSSFPSPPKSFTTRLYGRIASSRSGKIVAGNQLTGCSSGSDPSFSFSAARARDADAQRWCPSAT